MLSSSEKPPAIKLPIASEADSRRIACLVAYAKADAKAAGLVAPDTTEVPVLADFMSFAGSRLFLPGDPFQDNQKRNLAICVYCSFDLDEIFAFCQNWLTRWRRNGTAEWYQEVAAIVARKDPVELTDILLSHNENRVRQRLSMPFAAMLSVDSVLAIKRKGRREEI